MALIDESVHIPVPTQCDLCDSEDEVNSFCRNCAQKLCDICKKSHLRSTQSRDHVVVHVSERPCLTDEPTICQEHSNSLIFYCRNCSSLSCSLCWPKYHNGHNFIETAEYAKEVKSSLSSLVAGKEEESNAKMRDLKTIEEAQKAYIEEMNESKSKVKQGAKEIIDKIRNIEQEQLSEIDQKESDGLAVFEQERKRIVEEQSDLKESIQKIKTDCAIQDNVMLIRSASGMQQQTDAIDKDLSLVVPVVQVIDEGIQISDLGSKIWKMQTRDKDYRTGQTLEVEQLVEEPVEQPVECLPELVICPFCSESMTIMYDEDDNYEYYYCNLCGAEVEKE